MKVFQSACFFLTIYTLLYYCTAIVVAQNCAIGSENNKEDEAPADKAQLLREAHKGVGKAVLALGQQGDASVIPELKRCMEEARTNKFVNPNIIRVYRKVLAKLGDIDACNEIIDHLKRNRTWDQERAFQDVVYIRGNYMIQSVALKLYDPTPDGRAIKRDKDGKEIVSPDVIIRAPREAAVIVLSQVIDDPTAPRIDVKKRIVTDDDVKKWRQWWEANSNKYFNVSSSNEVIKVQAP